MKKYIFLITLMFYFILNADTRETGIFEISESVKAKITGNSFKAGGPVDYSDLALIRVKYINFDDKEMIGEIIVNKKLADDVYEIFQELHKVRYPIKKISLIDEYNNSDELSMADNNTYSFSVRAITGGNKYSNHAYGRAVDINPIQNPYIKNKIIEPENGKNYLDRKNVRKGMIVKGDACYNAFKKRGWTWGGEWKSLKDFQHFEKR